MKSKSIKVAQFRNIGVDVHELVAEQRIRIGEAINAALVQFLQCGGTPSDNIELIITLSDGCGAVGSGSIDEIALSRYTT